MSVDAKTLKAYEERAGQYAGLTSGSDAYPTLSLFIGAVAAGGRVLDLGCGPAHTAAIMSRAGLSVDAVDASPEMAKQALSLYGITVSLQSFDDLDADARYDGVWASFSLLHAPRRDLPRHLGAIHRALKPGGVLFLGMKTGSGERRDRLGRWYSYYRVKDLKGLLQGAGFSVTGTHEGRDKGLSGDVSPWVVVAAYA